MKLLFDNNLSPRLVRRLADLYPGTSHVRTRILQSAPDEQMWQEAATGGFIIVAKDDDFQQLAFAGIGATIGLVIGPVLAWGLLRSVKLWRVVGESGFGAILGSFGGWGIASVGLLPGISTILGGGIVGAVAAGVLLRRRVSRVREAAP